MVLSLLLLAGCPDSEDVNWVRFNDSNETIDIDITASDELGESISIALLSSTGSVEVATATVNPGSGPVGTDHDFEVVVDDEWQEIVGRVSVDADSGDRGEETFELRQDSADHGYWVASITSLGADGEERTDTFAINLWSAEETEAEFDTAESER